MRWRGVKRCPKCERGGSGPHPAFCTAEDRFWRRVNKTDGCWEWTGAHHPFGYGQFRIGNGSKQGKLVSAHRYSYELHKGAIGPGLSVLHECDNPKCVRPDHLYQGTAADNFDDMVRRARRFIQERKTHCKHGHAFTPANTMRGKGGAQRCRECENTRRRKPDGYYARRQANGL